MGEKGQPTRMLAAKYGGYLTFGALGGGKESAPGQPTLHQLKHMYRLPDLTSSCRVGGCLSMPATGTSRCHLLSCHGALTWSAALMAPCPAQVMQTGHNKVASAIKFKPRP